MRERATFGKGHATFQVGKLNWTPLPFEAKRTANIPSKRYLHSAALLDDRLYLLGGTDNDSEFRDHRLYCLELVSMKWTTIEGRNYCEGRNGHACAVFKNELYFFGGSQHQSNPTNDFFKFSPTLGTWMLLECEEGLPPERELAVMGSLNNEYLFLLGGIDLPEDRIHEDAFIFRQGKWLKLAIRDAPSERVRMTVAVCERRLFAFGGEGPGEMAPALFDNLYEVTIDQFELQMAFLQIRPRGRRPSKRTAHAMVAVSPRFLLLYGGEGRREAEGNGSSSSGDVLGDIWLYDVEEMAWTEIQTIYGSMTPRCEFTLTLHRNELFIFGGMNEEHAVVDDLAKLEFVQERTQPSEPCEECRMHLAPPDCRPPSQAHPLISTGFYYNLALEISFPFRAVEIITEVAEELGAETIKINSGKTVEDFDYLSFDFTARQEVSAGCFLHLAQSNQSPQEASLMHLLKIGALRLGKTFLYIEASAGQRRVLLMSADSRFAPNFQDSPMHYSYVQGVQTGECFFGGSFGSKQAVTNILKSQLADPFGVLSRTEGNLLLIFQLNILPTVEKAYYYELIFYSHPEADIRIYHNERKTEMLQTLGYNTNSLPDFSCRAYLRLSKLRRKIKPRISNDQDVPVESYLDFLRGQQGLEELSLGKFGSKLVQKCVIFQCGEEYVEGNQGVLVYCGNHLIDRHDCRLGQLISDKFYKKKYRRRQNLFRYAGVLYLSPALKLNLTSTRPATTSRIKYQEILEELLSKIKAARSQGKEDTDMTSLFSRFVYSRDSGKRQKRDSNNAS